MQIGRTSRRGTRTLSVLAAIALSLPALDIIWAGPHTGTAGTVSAGAQCASTSTILDGSDLTIIDRTPNAPSSKPTCL
jgi:hypothetical protein